MNSYNLRIVNLLVIILTVESQKLASISSRLDVHEINNYIYQFVIDKNQLKVKSKPAEADSRNVYLVKTYLKYRKYLLMRPILRLEDQALKYTANLFAWPLISSSKSFTVNFKITN